MPYPRCLVCSLDRPCHALPYPRCLVCSLDRHTLEEACGGFSEHTQGEHNPWAYAFFVHYLTTKKETEQLWGVEADVLAKLGERGKGGDTSFIPRNDCGTLQSYARRKGECQEDVKEHFGMFKTQVQHDLQGVEALLSTVLRDAGVTRPCLQQAQIRPKI